MNKGVLEAKARRLTLWLALRVVLYLAAFIGAAILAFLLADAALDLPAPMRSAAGWVLGGGALVAVAFGLWQWHKSNELNVARQFESAEPGLGNCLTNAVQLSEQTARTSLEEYFRRATVELGRSTAGTLRTWPIVRWTM